MNQARQKENIRGASFEALGALSRFAMGVQHEAFMEQVVPVASTFTFPLRSFSYASWGAAAHIVVKVQSCDSSNI